MSTELRALLTHCRLFQQVNLTLVGALLNSCSRHQLMPGDTLIEAEAHNQTLYLVLSGQLRVYAGGRDMPSNALLDAGDCAGEMSFIDGQRSSALVLAAAPSELLGIPHERMWEMMDADPMIARNLLAIMSGRLRNNNLTLVTTQSVSLEFAEASLVDPLTSLHNRSWIEPTFMRQVRRCRRDMVPVCLLFADLDLLEEINTRNGYLTGDNALKRVARAIAEALRPQDLLGRWGGDEFAVLLPATPPAEALAIGQRLCAAVIAASVIVPPRKEPLTLSCGVIPIKAEDTLTSAFTRARVAVEEAKAKGRNRAELVG
jgi:diguanylate cyclase (GGDEF)-like protein